MPVPLQVDDPVRCFFIHIRVNTAVTVIIHDLYVIHQVPGGVNFAGRYGGGELPVAACGHGQGFVFQLLVHSTVAEAHPFNTRRSAGL